MRYSILGRFLGLNGEISAPDSYLLASNAAYNYQGNVEKLNAVLDGQNEINKMVSLYGNI